MNFELIDLGKWFYYDMSNYNSRGFTFMLTKCGASNGKTSYTNVIKLVKISETNGIENVVFPINGVISGSICCDLKSFVIYNYRKDGQVFFCSTLTDKKLTKTSNTSTIPWGERIIIAEHQGIGFDFEDTIYECYDERLNLIWRYHNHGYINDGAYKIYKDYIEIGTENKLFFDKKGILESEKAPRILIEKSDWYANDEDRSIIKQTGEKCATRQSLAKCLFNGKEYVLHCNSPTKQYVAKLDLNFKLIWKTELSDCLGTYQLLFYNGVYFSIGYKTRGTFYICTINESGEILEQSENIKANEVYGHIINGKLVIFYNRTDNLSKQDKKLFNDGVMIANGYCLIVDVK